MKDSMNGQVIYQGRRINPHEKTLSEVEISVIRDGFASSLNPTPSQKLRNHSPDGFNWGYGGSGAAQLALGILLDFLKDETLAQHFYQVFKFHKVAKWGDEWFISGTEINNWIINEAGFTGLLDHLLEMATDRPWYILEVLGNSFVAAKPTDDHPYYNKTRNIDIAGDEDYPRKQDDMKLITATVNLLPLLLQKIQKLEESDKALKQAHTELTRLGIDEAKGKPCDEPDCNSHIVHRIRELQKKVYAEAAHDFLNE